ncbi:MULTISPECIES: LAETG motif-containing sortase-dependent surface protein [unclassified Kitasatospora]|uniref:LAETG motif-containing sortase-dependent surface protein n=1 Tax=unclassified Kitasatospora TaxID=2633591 RepID=UPI003427F537
MRSSRLLAASALMALSFGTTVGAVSASAVGVPSSPPPTSSTATPSAPAPSTPAPSTPAPSTTPSAPATATPSTTPSHTATATPTNRPSTLPMPTPTNSMRCHGGVYQSPLLKVTGSGLYGTTLVKGGPAAELSVTWQNNSGVDLPVVHNSLYVTDEFDGDYPVQWSTEFFDVQLNTGSGWKPAKLDDRDLQSPDIKLAKGEKITYQVRIAATAKAPVGNYGANYDAGSDAFDNDKVPTPANDKPNACTQFYNPFEGKFRVAEAGGASSTPAAAGHGSASASPSAGPHLAETGADSNTLPIALGGAAVLAAGAGTVFVLRRRKAGAHS